MSQAAADAAGVHPDAAELEVKLIGEAQLAVVKTTIAATVLPITDPLSGSSGPIADLWLGR
jgi:uncharacterized protein YjlB